MNSKPTRTVLALAVVAMAALVLTATSANAALITVNGFDSWNAGSSPITGTFDASSSDKLVVIVTGEHGWPNNAGGDCTGVTYDGVALTQAVDRDPIITIPDPNLLVDQTYNDIWYLDNPATSTGEIVASVVTRGNVTVFGLSGTALGVGNTAISPQDSNSVSLTTSAADSIVIASYGMGGYGNTANVDSVDADAPLIETSAQENGSRWDGHVTGYALVASAGPGTYSFTGGNLSGSHTIAAEFTAVPEPATMALLGFGGLALLKRRRHA